MIILSWNVRGMNTLSRMKVFTLMTHAKPIIVGLVETKLSKPNLALFTSMLHSSWKFMTNNSEVSYGRILLIQDSNVWNLSVLASSFQHISVNAVNKGGLNMIVSTIYANIFLWKDRICGKYQ